MTAIARALGPLTGVVYRTRSASFVAAVPHPLDHPRASAEGPSPLRILLFGSGAANGWGVATHDLGLAGFLARDLAAKTGRGVDVEVRAAPSVTIDGVARMLGAEGAVGFDAAVHVLSYRNAFEGVAPARWRASLLHLVDLLEDTGGPGLPIVLTGSSPARTVSQFGPLVRAIVEPHAEELNRETAALAATRPNLRYLRLPGRSSRSLAHRSSDDYRMGGLAIAAALLPMLAERPSR